MTHAASSSGQPDAIDSAADVLAQLRAATGSRHARLDSCMPLSIPAPTLADYRDHLRLLLIWLRPLEALLRAHADGPQAAAALAPVWRSGLIEADLAEPATPSIAAPDAFADRAAHAPAWPTGAAPAWRWGACYVIEGSQLGGAMLYQRHVARLAPHPLNYLRGDGAPPGPRWQQFLRALRADVHTTTEIELARAGAIAAFDHLLAIVGAPPVASPRE